MPWMNEDTNFIKEALNEIVLVLRRLAELQQQIVESFLQLRQQLRDEGKFGDADRIREVLTKQGVKVKDVKRKPGRPRGSKSRTHK